MIPTGLSGTAALPPSKSMSHRALFIAALKGYFGESFTVSNCSDCDDVRLTARALIRLGLIERIGEGRYASVPLASRRQPSRVMRFSVGESATTLRFLLPFCAALGVKAYFVMRPGLARRIEEKELQPFNEHGASCAYYRNRLSLRGRLQPGEYRMEADKSSQWISGLLLSLPMLEAPSTVVPVGIKVSVPYTELTYSMLYRVGARMALSPRGFVIPPYQTEPDENCTIPRDTECTVSVDETAALYEVLLASAAAKPEGLLLKNFHIGEVHADGRFFYDVRTMRLKYDEEEDGLRVYPQRLDFPEELAMKDYPDLVPYAAALAAFLPYTVRLTGTGRLRFKESSRGEVLAEELKKLGGRIRVEEDELICGGSEAGEARSIRLEDGAVRLNGFGDHRIVMAELLAAYAVGAPVLLEGAESVAKSWPSFWSDLRAVGLYAVDEDDTVAINRRKYSSEL